jgi:hypothetical protein
MTARMTKLLWGPRRRAVRANLADVDERAAQRAVAPRTGHVLVMASETSTPPHQTVPATLTRPGT